MARRYSDFVWLMDVLEKRYVRLFPTLINRELTIIQ